MKEEELDRLVNKGHVHFRKFLDETTCPACNLPDCFQGMLNSEWDEENQKVIHAKHIHDTDGCFTYFHQLIMALEKDKEGHYISHEKIMEKIKFGLKKLKSMDKEFTEKQK